MVVVVACVLLLVATGLVLVAGLRQHLRLGTRDVWSEWVEPEGPDAPPEDWGGGGYGGVREPRRPLPSGGAASVALPEPDDRAA